MSVLEAIILGILQGITEFLPVSSSGHIELGKAILHADIKNDLSFTLLLHGATVLSTIVIFRKDIVDLLRQLFKCSYNTETAYISKLLFSMLPVFFIGTFFKTEIESLFEANILLVGSMLIVTAILLVLTTLEPKQKSPITYTKALIIGIAQAVAVLPGISRSGATISTALLLGVDKPQATQFSFLMVLTPIIGASLLETKNILAQPHITTATNLPIIYISGFLAAFIAGLIACKLMISIVNAGKIAYFAIYCLIVGSIAIASYFI